MMPRGSTAHDKNYLDATTSEGESSSSFEIDLLNLRPAVKRGGGERYSRYVCDSFDEGSLPKIPVQPIRGKSRKSANEDIAHSDVGSAQFRGRTPRIIRAIRHHSERLNEKYRSEKPTLSHESNSKSSVVVLHNEGRDSDAISTPKSTHLPPIRLSKSERTLVTVALPVTEKLPVCRESSPNRAASDETNSTCTGTNELRRRKLTRRRYSQQPKRPYARKSHREPRRTERCRAPDRLARCLMAHRSTCQEQVGTGGTGEDERLGVKNPKVAFLMQHLPEPRKRGDTKAELEESSNGEKRVFPFQPTASGNLKIVPNQVVFESKKVSVLVADPRHTRVNVKAELGKGENNAEQSVETTEIASQQTKNVVYVPRTKPFRSTQNIRLGEMEENQVSETTHNRTPQTTNEVPLSSLGFTGEQAIDWQNITLPEKTDLYRELARRITNYKNADCIVRLGHDEFHCHLLVLQSYSTYFDEKNYKEVDLTGSNVTSKAFGTIYDWMISSTSESCHLLRRDNILEIFTAAQQLGIKELEEQCWAFIDNDELFTEDTAFLLYLEARKIGNTAVMELMVPRIMKFFLMLVSTRDFLELSVEELCLLLRSNYISVNSEMEVLMSAVRWLMHDWQSRRQHMIQVLKCVRFGLIAPWQLVDVKRNPENPEFMELMSFPEVQKMVDDGLAFVIIKYWYGNQTEDYYHWIDLLGLTEPTNRNWAGEDKNYVTYREFLLYLEEYQKTRMPELKSRKSPEARGAHQHKDCGPGLPGASNSIRKPEESALFGPPGVGICPLLLAASSNLGRPEKYVGRTAGSPGIGGTGGPPAMSPEILGRYLSSFDRNAKGTRNSLDAATVNDETSRKSSNPHGHHWIESCEKIGVAGEKKLDRCEGTPREYKGDEEDSCKSEEDAATTIQAIYRGYKARSRFHEIRKSCSEERQKTRKIANLLAINGSRMCERLDKPLEPVRQSVSLAGRGKNELSRIPRGSSSPRNKRPNSSTRTDHLAIKDLEGLRLEAVRSGELRGHRDTGDSIKTIHRPGTFHNLDDKTSSVSQSDDTDADPFTPRMNSSAIRPRDEALPLRISESIIGERKVTAHYHGKDSLFFANSESIIVFGGLDPHQEYGNGANTGKDMYRFKSVENEWEFVGEIPEPRHHHSTVYLRGRVYLVGGADPRTDDIERKDVVVGTVWSYDPTTRVWFMESELLTPRRDFGLVVSDGKMFAIGGMDKNGVALKSVEAYDPAERTWKEMRPMSAARIGPAATKYRELIWVGGGMAMRSKKELLSRDVECYDPLNDRWMRAEPLRSPRCFGAMYVVGDCLYAIGGATKKGESGGTTESIGQIDHWDRKSLVWRNHGEICIARHGHTVGSVGDQLLIIGGLTTVYMSSLQSVERYCCQTGKGIKGASALPHPLSGHGCVSLPAANFITTT